MNNERIIFTDKVLDNVHGFIPYTEAEGKIINMLLFKRMQSIKQLSIVNWIFPGSEHTRYVHSLGVMHICDKIAVQLGLTEYERRIVRFAGLLHDIGHYPLSHVCEFPYKTSIEKYSDSDSDFCHHINNSIKRKIDGLDFKIKTDFMSQSTGGHHEAIGESVIRNDENIKQIIITECDEEDAVDIICDMITGNVNRTSTDPLLVQILHSELDADGIDYMLRDATFSGTSFGSFELDLLIRCMCIAEVKGKRMLCINSKGVAAADQYLINKFFSYSQIVCNKHVAILEWMAEHIVDWMQKNDTYFPSRENLLEWIKHPSDSEYLGFTDNFFWNSLNRIVDNPAIKTFPKHIIELCHKLLNHDELKFRPSYEVKIVSDNQNDILSKVTDSELYRHLEVDSKYVSLYNEKEITKHVPEKVFKNRLLEIKKNMPEEIDEEDFLLHRLMDGICVYDPGVSNDVHLLCDDPKSLMQYLYGKKLIVLRSYEFSEV